MKHIIAAVVGCATPALGTFIPLDVWRETGVSGYAGPSGYESIETSSGLGTFHGSVSGLADASNPVVPWPGPFSGHSKTIAGQLTTITPDGINGTGSFSYESWTGFLDQGAGPGRSAQAFAWNLLDLTFLVETPQAFELDLTGFMIDDAPHFRTAEFSFNSLSGLTLATKNVHNGYLDTSWTGILEPDTYHMRFWSQLLGSSDPLGDNGYGNWKLEFSVTNVPENGSTFLYLTIGTLAMLCIARPLKLS